jgi:hypothetical protein
VSPEERHLGAAAYYTTPLGSPTRRGGPPADRDSGVAVASNAVSCARIVRTAPDSNHVTGFRTTSQRRPARHRTSTSMARGLERRTCMKQTTMTLFAAVLLSACGGSDGNGEELIGTWGGASLSLTFHPEGTFDAEPGARSGTWEADGHRLTMEGLSVEHASETFGYVIHQDALMLGAHLPDGSTDGVVGTWRGEWTQDDLTIEETIELAADGTGHITAIASDPSEAIDADLVWELDSLLRLDWDNGDGSSTLRSMFVLPDVAIGGFTLARAGAAP